MSTTFVPCTSVVRVEMMHGVQGQLAINVFHVYKNSGAWDSTEMNSLAATFKTWWDSNIKAIFTHHSNLAEIRVTDLTTQSSPGITYVTGLPISGTHSTGTPEPNNVTAVISWRTALRGRSYRGRTYIPGLSSDQVDGNSLVSGFVTSLQAAGNALITAIPTSEHRLVVCSKFSNNAPREYGITTDIVSCRVDTYVDSMRRRLAGRGPAF